MSTARAIRWGDNDRYFGPFTFSRDKRYRPFAVVLGSGDDDDYPGCRLRMSALGGTVIVALPSIIKPERRKVFPGWDAATVARLGRDWYWDASEREYGFSLTEGGFLQVFRGRRTHDSSTDRTWSMFLPWTQWRHVRHSLYGLDGALFAHMPHSARFGTPEREAGERLEKACPTAVFNFRDHDGEALTVTTKIEEREWRLGERAFRWLSLFAKPKVRRSLDLWFSGETGKRKGSWKGGTIGAGIDLEPGELHESGFRRYCEQNGMTFVGGAS